jgi:hypothetical protein
MKILWITALALLLTGCDKDDSNTQGECPADTRTVINAPFGVFGVFGLGIPLVGLGFMLWYLRGASMKRALSSG